MAVDPGGELVDPGVDPRPVGSAAARPPADDAHQKPATSCRGPADQRTPRVSLRHAGKHGTGDCCRRSLCRLSFEPMEDGTHPARVSFSGRHPGAQHARRDRPVALFAIRLTH